LSFDDVASLRPCRAARGRWGARAFSALQKLIDQHQHQNKKRAVAFLEFP